MINDACFKMLLLHCLHKIDGQRTIYSILHLLNGKKSAQTIQDAHLFQLTTLFGTGQMITRFDLDNIIAALVDENFVTEQDKQIYTITKEGKDHLRRLLANESFPKDLNGWKFHNITSLYWERLSFFVQVTSELRHGNAKYIPIQQKKETHSWLKKFLIQTELSREDLSVQLYHELRTCLEANKEINPAVLVIRLTGNNRIGLTARQAAEFLGLSYCSYHLQFLSILHYMLEQLNNRENSFPLLFQIISDQITNSSLTVSARKTYPLLKRGWSIKEIADRRKLKQNTIEDHIVEIALNIAEFDISPYISEDLQELIARVARNNSSKQLKHIRQLVPHADYFQIRLVLAKAGDKR